MTRALTHAVDNLTSEPPTEKTSSAEWGGSEWEKGGAGHPWMQSFLFSHFCFGKVQRSEKNVLKRSNIEAGM